MVPLDFKETARQLEHLVLVLDGYTANLPWEMLIADEKPLVLQTAVVRQLASSRFRARIRSTTDRTAYVVGDPSTSGFDSTFGDPNQHDAPVPSTARRRGARSADGGHDSGEPRLPGGKGAVRSGGAGGYQQAVQAAVPPAAHRRTRPLRCWRTGREGAQRRRPVRRPAADRRRSRPDGDRPRTRFPQLLLSRQDGSQLRSRSTAWPTAWRAS